MAPNDMLLIASCAPCTTPGHWDAFLSITPTIGAVEAGG